MIPAQSLHVIDFFNFRSFFFLFFNVQCLVAPLETVLPVQLIPGCVPILHSRKVYYTTTRDCCISIPQLDVDRGETPIDWSTVINDLARYPAVTDRGRIGIYTRPSRK